MSILSALSFEKLRDVFLNRTKKDATGMMGSPLSY